MNKTLKYVLIAIASVLALLLAVVAFIAATFDPNEYKPQLIELVKEKTQRNLSIPGDIELSLFPKIGATLGSATLSERNSTDPFVAFDSARVSLALMPLLRKQLVVDQVQLEGLQATIVRNRQGETNYEDLIEQEPPPQQPEPQEESGQVIQFDIDSVDIRNAHLIYDDRQQDRRIEVANLNLETGRIANGVESNAELSADVKGNKPAMDVHVTLQTGFTLDLESGQYAVRDLDAALKGALAGMSDLAVNAQGNAEITPKTKRFVLNDIQLAASGKQKGKPIEVKLDIPDLSMTDTKVSGGKLSGAAKLVQGTRAIDATFSAPAFEGSPQAFKVPSLTLDAAVKDAGLDAKAKLSGALTGDIDKMLFTSPQVTLKLGGRQGETTIDGTLTTPVSADLQNKVFELAKLVADLTLPNPGGGSLKLKTTGNMRANLGNQTAFANLKGNLDQSAFDARFNVTGFTPASYNFDVNIDRLDLDRYRSKTTEPATEAKTKRAPSAGTAPKAGQAAAQQDIDFSMLQDLRANGRMRIGALKVANMQTSNVRIDLRAANGKLSVSPLAANLYGGTVAGSLSLIAAKPARFAVDQKLTGVHLGPLLKDAIGKAPIEGTGNVTLDVTTSGLNFDQIKRGLNGTAQLSLRDGAISGVNIAQTVRNAKSKLDALRGKSASDEQAGTASAAEKTDFSEMTGSFHIANGVAKNDDLDVKSPLIRVGGSGTIDLGAERLDYLAKATVVSTLKGQGGPELQALKGVTVPVRLSGPFTAINWKIDVGGIAREMTQKKVEEKQEELKSKAEEKFGEQQKKLEEKLKGGLKGLLGK